MGRRTRLVQRTTHQPFGELTVYQFDPGTGWSLSEAADLVAQGYSAAIAATRTGFPERLIVNHYNRFGDVLRQALAHHTTRESS